MGHSGTWLLVRPRVASYCTVALGVCLLENATAIASETDGVYGRLDGDITLSPNLGVQHYRGDTNAAVGLQAMYVSTLGLSLQQADSKFFVGKRSVNRGVTTLEMRLSPLFLSRWSQASELGPPLFDLTLDSFTIGLGAYWDYDRNSGSLRRGTSLSTSLAIPLMAKAGGPWLSTTLALRLAEGTAFSAQADVMYGLLLSWAFLVDSRLHDDNP